MSVFPWFWPCKDLEAGRPGGKISKYDDGEINMIDDRITGILDISWL